MPDAAPDTRTVVIDTRMARRRRTGTATYIRELTAALDAVDHPGLRIVTVSGPPPLPRRNVATTIGNLALDLAWTHLLLPLAALRHRAALIHSPFNWGPALAPCPTVTTVHDLAWERVPDTFPGYFRRFARWATRLSARRSRLLITDSRATADDLTEMYGTPREKTRTVPIGIHPDRAPDDRPREPFILAVGEFEPRKRILELLAGHNRYLAAAPADPPPCRLVVVGSGGSQETIALSAAGERVTFTGFVDHETLADYYRRATLLVYPSSYEGFGLPVLEAMSHGCPALVAQNSSLVEVGGDVALPLTDPTVPGIAQALLDALADRDALAERGRRSREHAAGYDWDAVARRTLDVYREAIDR